MYLALPFSKTIFAVMRSPNQFMSSTYFCVNVLIAHLQKTSFGNFGSQKSWNAALTTTFEPFFSGDSW